MNKYFRKYWARKYLIRIILSINLLIVSFMMVSLLAAYLYSEKISLDSQQEANEKVLSQINYNISYMNETVKNFAISFFYDNDMAQLLYSGEVDDFEDTMRINKLNKTIDYNSFIHSIVIYNNKRGSYFTIGNDSITSEKSNLLKIIDDYLDGRKLIYKMQLIPVEFIPDSKHPEKTQEVFSLYMYDPSDTYTKTESALIINVKPEWLFQKMKMMNNLSSNRSNRMFIIDQNKEIYSPTVQTNLNFADLKSEIYRRIASSDQQVAQFAYSEDNEKLLVNYMINTSINWVIVDIEPYTSVLSAVNKLKTAFIIVAAVCFVLALFASLFVSNKLYYPIDVLMKETKRLPGNETDVFVEKDEISYMSHIYNQLINKLRNEETKQKVNENILRSYYLRKLITDSSAFSEDEVQECIAKGYLNVNLEHGIIIGVLKIDNYERLTIITKGFDLKLLHFAISNIILEMVSEESAEFNGEIVSIRGEHLVLLFDVGKSGSAIHDQITILLKRAQSIVNDYYHITFTVALSDLVPKYSEITFHYENVLDLQMYRMNFGISSVITPQMVKHNLENHETQIPVEMERKLIEAIKLNSREMVNQQLDAIRVEIAAMSSDSVVQSVIHLSIIIKQTLREINLNKLSPLLIDLRSIDRLVFERETLTEIFTEFATILSEIFIERKQIVENKDHVLVETIKEMIQANYSNANLSLQEIAEMLKMSTAYVGRIFKKYETLSFAEYLNEIRLLKSLTLLEKNNLLVSEIVEMVGFSTQSYFFKMFRKRFGTTPKEYRIKNSLK